MKFIKGSLLLLIIVLIQSCVPRKENAEEVMDLTGTTWNIKYKSSRKEERRNYNITFGKNSKISSTHPNDNTKHNDTWSQDKKTVTMSFNNGYATYVGTIINNSRMLGTTNNKLGLEWKWKARLVKR